MKTILLTGYILFSGTISFCQEILLKDSVIYIDQKPAAFYTTTLSNSMPRYNMEVYNLQRKTVIEAEVIEFAAPVKELKSFFYKDHHLPDSINVNNTCLEANRQHINHEMFQMLRNEVFLRI